MVKTRAFVALVIMATLTSSAMAGSTGQRALPRTTGNSVIVANHLTQIDASSSTVRGTVGRLLFALWTLRTIGLVDISTVGGGYQLDGIQDGSDPFAKDKGINGLPVLPPTTSVTRR
jgi:hypothetical protein